MQTALESGGGVLFHNTAGHCLVERLPRYSYGFGGGIPLFGNNVFARGFKKLGNVLVGGHISGPVLYALPVGLGRGGFHGHSDGL